MGSKGTSWVQPRHELPRRLRGIDGCALDRRLGRDRRCNHVLTAYRAQVQTRRRRNRCFAHDLDDCRCRRLSDFVVRLVRLQSLLHALDHGSRRRGPRGDEHDACLRAGGIAAEFVMFFMVKKWDTAAIVNGFLAGLVAITCPCYWVSDCRPRAQSHARRQRAGDPGDGIAGALSASTIPSGAWPVHHAPGGIWGTPVPRPLQVRPVLGGGFEPNGYSDHSRRSRRTPSPVCSTVAA